MRIGEGPKEDEMRLARRDLLADPVRFLLSVLGVAVSIALILLLAGYRSGVYALARIAGHLPSGRR